jgi:hypothetical protein
MVEEEEEGLSLTALTIKLTSIQTLATNLLADTMLLRLFTAHTLSYTIPALGLQVFVLILEPRGWG